jgi:hypothetical protein
MWRIQSKEMDDPPDWWRLHCTSWMIGCAVKPKAKRSFRNSGTGYKGRIRPLGFFRKGSPPAWAIAEYEQAVANAEQLTEMAGASWWIQQQLEDARNKLNYYQSFGTVKELLLLVKAHTLHPGETESDNIILPTARRLPDWPLTSQIGILRPPFLLKEGWPADWNSYIQGLAEEKYMKKFSKTFGIVQIVVEIIMSVVSVVVDIYAPGAGAALMAAVSFAFAFAKQAMNYAFEGSMGWGVILDILALAGNETMQYMGVDKETAKNAIKDAVDSLELTQLWNYTTDLFEGISGIDQLPNEIKQQYQADIAELMHNTYSQ